MTIGRPTAWPPPLPPIPRGVGALPAEDMLLLWDVVHFVDGTLGFAAASA